MRAGYQVQLVVAPMRSSLDCPVPRLTLLFFGAAKDVPEAAKMVTAGTACLAMTSVFAGVGGGGVVPGAGAVSRKVMSSTG
jgi:hypothetical protein